MNAANRRLRRVCTRIVVALALLAATAAAGGMARADGASERAAKEATGTSLRRALRTATVLLAARAAQAAYSATPQGKLPMTVFVGPVTAGAMNASGAAPATGEKQSDAAAAGVTFYVAQSSALHGMIADFAGAAIRGDGGDTIFAVRAGSRRRGRGSSAPPTEDAEREMARKAGSDYLIEAALRSVAGDAGDRKGGTESGSGGNAVHLDLQLVSVRDGTVVCASDTALPEVSTAAKDSPIERKKG